ncbi:hypothetical protein [Aquimarina sp. I32.4]|uniref:hypothetical protein n=1 Tax=Aquimarina sp. I32.4 TaxID=2053903 RepID=UPI000CDE9CE6|nr:hypothetical protein [Aquimarina sp. I32.4]
MPTRNWFKKDALPFKILTEPTHKNVTKWFNNEIGGSDDEELILILQSRGFSMMGTAFYVLWLVQLLIMTIIAIFSDKSNIDLDLLLYSSPLFIIGTALWIYNLITPTKKIVLKRYTGMMTYPSYGFYPHMTLTFTRATVYKSLISGPDATIGGYKLAARNPYNTGVGKGNYDLAPADPEEWWSYFVWYMDQNRPLPPGKSFDPYRDKDFERRKAAGFPKPLYKSNIPTPEATKEQQAERERIGGW